MTPAAERNRVKVFISYSRIDAAFADELGAGLEFDGRFDVIIDRHSILEGEEWQARLGALIADADTVVFILSPSSATSAICAWEVEQAHRLSKRILPVLAVPIGAARVPAQLSALNYVRFDPLEDGRPRSFMAGLNALVRALNTDVDWLREHTRYLSLARSWDDVGRPDNRLLSGSDIAAAKDWLARRRIESPEPTPLHLDFIRASEDAQALRLSEERNRLATIEAAQTARATALAEAERATAEKAKATRRVVRVTLAGAGVALLLVLVSAGLAYYASRQKLLAEERANLARAETARADRQVNLISTNPAGTRAMNKICLEAITVTSTLFKTSDREAQRASHDRFWELYFGPMYIIELHQRKASVSNNGPDRSAIESSMVRFGDELRAAVKANMPLPHSTLCPLGSEVRAACNEYLKLNVPAESCR